MRTNAHRPQASGYTLVETLAAAVILSICAGAAASLSLVMVSQEEIALRVSVGLAHQEDAARLYQLGLSPAEVSAILPPNPVVESLNFTEGASAAIGSELGPMQYADVEIAIQSTADATKSWSAGAWTGGKGSADQIRTSNVRAYRFLGRGY